MEQKGLTLLPQYCFLFWLVEQSNNPYDYNLDNI